MVPHRLSERVDIRRRDGPATTMVGADDVNHPTPRRSVRSRLAVVAAMSVLASSLLTSCNPAGTLAALNSAISELESQSANIQQTLLSLERNLTDDAGDLIRGDVQQLITNTTNVLFEQWECHVDIFRERIKLDLIRFRESIVRSERIPPKPWLCTVSPTSIDLNLPEAMRNQIELSGWNLLVAKDELKVYHQRGAEKVDVTAATWDPQTNYHATITLGVGGIVVDPDLEPQRVIIETRTDQALVSSIRVVPKAIEECPPQSSTSHTAAFVTLTPDHKSGDREVFGKVDLYASATLMIPDARDRVDVEVYMKAEQWDDDHSLAEGTQVFPFFDAVPPGWEVDHLEASVLTAEASHRDTTWEEETTGGGDTFVRQWVWYGDRNGEDLGGHTRVDVHFNPVTVVLRPKPGCVVPG
jgi:hypothetical protein